MAWDREAGQESGIGFFPSRCLDWGIAMTSADPLLIKANCYWDPRNEDVDMRRVLHYLPAELAKTDSRAVDSGERKLESGISKLDT